MNWASLAKLDLTLCIYMGLSTAGHVAARLMAHGLSAATPALVVENGTRPDQRVLRGRLDNLAASIEAAGLSGPAMIVIGAVAAESARDVADLAPHVLAV